MKGSSYGSHHYILFFKCFSGFQFACQNATTCGRLCIPYSTATQSSFWTCHLLALWDFSHNIHLSTHAIVVAFTDHRTKTLKKWKEFYDYPICIHKKYFMLNSCFIFKNLNAYTVHYSPCFHKGGWFATLALCRNFHSSVFTSEIPANLARLLLVGLLSETNNSCSLSSCVTAFWIFWILSSAFICENSLYDLSPLQQV